jgi:hypothetical protein
MAADDLWLMPLTLQDFTPPKKGEASFSGLPYAKQWMARKDIDRFISSVNDNDGLKEASPVSQRGAGRSVSPTKKASYSSAEEPFAKHSARSMTSSTGVEVLQEGATVHVPLDSEERRLDARCVLDLPGYRENKVRTLLFKNNELEQTLKEERANVRRLVRANDALEKQLLQLNAARHLPRSAPAQATQCINAWSEADLAKSKKAESAAPQGGDTQQVLVLVGARLVTGGWWLVACGLWLVARDK